MINFVQFMTFATVARHKSITKAAQTLRVSQPAVSKHLKNLEQYYCIKLFERDSSALELTDLGRHFMRRVNAVLGQLDQIEKEFKSPLHVSESAPLKVAGSYTASANLLPSLLADFQKKHPSARIVLRTGATNSVKQMLLNSEVELAVLNEAPVNPNLISEMFRKEKLVFFVAPSHPLAKRRVLTMSGLTKVRLIATGGRGRLSATEKVLRNLNDEMQAKAAIRCATPEAVKTMVKKGVGVGILYGGSVMQEIRRRMFTRISIPGQTLMMQTYLVYYKDRPLSEHAQEFLTVLRKKRDQSK
jgi:DNA-binding transcriptional LysR family regulator